MDTGPERPCKPCVDSFLHALGVRSSSAQSCIIKCLLLRHVVKFRCWDAKAITGLGATAIGKLYSSTALIVSVVKRAEGRHHQAPRTRSTTVGTARSLMYRRSFQVQRYKTPHPPAATR